MEYHVRLHSMSLVRIVGIWCPTLANICVTVHGLVDLVYEGILVCIVYTAISKIVISVPAYSNPVFFLTTLARNRAKSTACMSARPLCLLCFVEGNVKKLVFTDHFLYPFLIALLYGRTGPCLCIVSRTKRSYWQATFVSTITVPNFDAFNSKQT